MKKNIKIKRIYEEFCKDDGKRVLVDRLWPRGLTKEKAKIDLWLKEIAPSNELRKWYNHDENIWKEFKKRYRNEILDKFDLFKIILEGTDKNITLLYSAKNTEYNNASALKEFLEEELAKEKL